MPEEEISLDDLSVLIDSSEGSEEKETKPEKEKESATEKKQTEEQEQEINEAEIQKLVDEPEKPKEELTLIEEDKDISFPTAEQETPKQEPKEKVDEPINDLGSLLGGDESSAKKESEEKKDIKPKEETIENNLQALENQLKENIEDLEKDSSETIETDKDGLPEEPDRILLYGASKVGKTHAVASMMEAMLKANPETSFHAIITDAGFLKTVKRYWNLRKLDISILKKQLNYYPIIDINEMFSVIKDIKSMAKKSDWIIVDVMSDFWERSQDKFIESCSDGITGIADLIVEASRDPSKFGTLSGLQWGYCKRLDNSISYYFVINAPCNVIATASEKDIGVATAIAGEDATEQSLGFMYEAFKTVGFRPAGQKHLSYKFDDIVFLGKLGTGKRFFSIIGSRDIDTIYERVPYATSFWESFIKHKHDVLEKELDMGELSK